MFGGKKTAILVWISCSKLAKRKDSMNLLLKKGTIIRFLSFNASFAKTGRKYKSGPSNFGFLKRQRKQFGLLLQFVEHF